MHLAILYFDKSSYNNKNKNKNPLHFTEVWRVSHVDRTYLAFAKID